jgi:hypothetical protein
MQTALVEASSTESALWSRLIQPSKGTLSVPAARAVLAITFTDADKARMHDLAQRNGEGKLSPAEYEDLKTYIRVANVLALLHAKARRSLKKR